MKKKLIAALMGLFALFSCFASGQQEGKSSGEKPYTVTMVIMGSQPKDEEQIEEKINVILEEELNTHLDLIVLPWGSAEQQLTIMLTGSEKIDTFVDFSSRVINKMNNGQIVDLTGLIDKYGNNIRNLYGDNVQKYNSLNGFTYGLPVQIERGSVPCVYLRKDIVEKYNLDLSTIREPGDLEAIYDIVQSGESNMTMLYSSSADDKPLDSLNDADKLSDPYGSFGVLRNQTENTKIENLFATDWYMDTASMLHGWYKKGYINQDATTTTENWRGVFKTGNVFSIIFFYHPATKVEFESSTGYEFEIVKFDDKPIMNSQAYNNVMYCIAQTSENPAKTMETLDFIYGSSEVMNLLNWGIEGEDYVFIDQEKGIITYPEGTTMENVGYSLNLGWELPNQFISHLWQGSDPQVWNNMAEWNDSAEASNALGFTFDSTGYEAQIAAINNVVNTYHGAISSGGIDPEIFIPKFLADLEKAGMSDFLKAKQAQFDQWLESK